MAEILADLAAARTEREQADARLTQVLEKFGLTGDQRE